MKNKVYIDYGYGGVYWSIEDIRRNANLLRRILKEVSDSVILKLANNEITIEEIINSVFEDKEKYGVLETDSDVIYVNWDIDNAYSSAKEMIEGFDKLEVLKYIGDLYGWNLEKLFSAIQNKVITLEQIYYNFIRDMDSASICIKNKTNE